MFAFLCLLVVKPQCHQGTQMLFSLSLISSSYGLALFSWSPVNKPSCQTVLFHEIPQLVKCVLR